MYCYNCGNRLDDGEKFCKYCGTKLERSQKTIDYVDNESSIASIKKKVEKKTSNNLKKILYESKGAPKKFRNEVVVIAVMFSVAIIFFQYMRNMNEYNADWIRYEYIFPSGMRLIMLLVIILSAIGIFIAVSIIISMNRCWIRICDNYIEGQSFDVSPVSLFSPAVSFKYNYNEIESITVKKNIKTSIGKLGKVEAIAIVISECEYLCICQDLKHAMEVFKGIEGVSSKIKM